MPTPLPKPRHMVEKSNALVRVILPSKKNVLYILGGLLWLFLWGYMVSAFLYIAVAFNKAIEMGRNASPPSQPGGVFTIFSIVFMLFFLVLLAMGAFGIYRFIWLLAGKEIFEANAGLLKIFRQTPLGKTVKEYSAPDVQDLRVVPLPVTFPFNRLQKLFRRNGMIAFDYGAKTFRFGQEIEEAEAKQIILALQEGLARQKAG